MAGNPARTPKTDYTTVDFNATGTTALFNPSGQSTVTGTFLDNPTSSTVVSLESTDGTNTASITTAQSAGDAIAVGDTIEIDSGQTLQANVTTANTGGQDGNNTAVVFHSDHY